MMQLPREHSRAWKQNAPQLQPTAQTQALTLNQAKQKQTSLEWRSLSASSQPKRGLSHALSHPRLESTTNAKPRLTLCTTPQKHCIFMSHCLNPKPASQHVNVNPCSRLMHICIYIHTYTRVHVCVHIYIIHVYIYMYIYTHIYIYERDMCTCMF